MSIVLLVENVCDVDEIVNWGSTVLLFVGDIVILELFNDNVIMVRKTISLTNNELKKL